MPKANCRKPTTKTKKAKAKGRAKVEAESDPFVTVSDDAQSIVNGYDIWKDSVGNKHQQLVQSSRALREL